MNSSPNSDRSRLARELHDGLAQELAALGYRLDAVIGNPNLDQPSRTELRNLRATTSAMVQQVRNEIFDLRNESDRSIAQSICQMLPQLLSETEIKYEISGEIILLKDKHYDLLRTIRELILNSKQHANCRNIEIALDATQIKYRDDGNFDNKKEREGFGLLGIKERLAKIGATLQQQDSNFVIEFK